jgi:hypothetical protein
MSVAVAVIPRSCRDPPSPVSSGLIARTRSSRSAASCRRAKPGSPWRRRSRTSHLRSRRAGRLDRRRDREAPYGSSLARPVGGCTARRRSSSSSCLRPARDVAIVVDAWPISVSRMRGLAKVYGHEHVAPKLPPSHVRGAGASRKNRDTACGAPGCFATTMLPGSRRSLLPGSRTNST